MRAELYFPSPDPNNRRGSCLIAALKLRASIEKSRSWKQSHRQLQMAAAQAARLSAPTVASNLFLKVKPATDAFTLKQLLYVLLLQGVGASAVCFGINFGVAVLVFRGQPPPYLFEFPLPLAGNFGIIIAVEVLLNYIISGSLQTLDVLNGICPPIKASAMGSFWPKRDSPYQ
jgi:hypothetical protein